MAKGPVRHLPVAVFEDGADPQLEGLLLPDDRGEIDFHPDPDLIATGMERTGEPPERCLLDHARAVAVEMVDIPVAVRGEIDFPVFRPPSSAL